MDPAEAKRVLDILEGACGLSANEFESYLDRECGGNLHLRREVLSYLDHDVEGTVLPAGMDIAPAPEIPQVVSETRYDLTDEIASGGVGVVLGAFDNNLNREVAVKVLRSEWEHNPDVIRRFLQEAQIGAQLQHPGIAPVYDIGRLPDGRPFIAMKLIKGATLKDLFSHRQDAANDQAKFLGIFEQVCQTIAFAHRRGVIHRDLKPSNVMVGEFGEVQVMDWGIAKLVNDQQPEASESEAPSDAGAPARDPVKVDTDDVGHSTRVGQAMGTPAYMAPEQSIGRAGKTADVFSLGVILCEILTGAPTDQAPSSTVQFDQTTHGHMHAAHRRLRQLGTDHELVQLVIECLAPDADKRPPDAAHVERRIRSYIESAEQRARQAEIAGDKARLVANEQRRRFRLAVAAGSIVFVLIVGGMLFYQHLRKQNAERLFSEQQRGLRQAEALGYWSTIHAAFGACETGQYHKAYDILQKSPPRLRDWEWHYLYGQIDNSVWHYRLPGERVHCALFQDGGQRIALITNAGIIKIIDRETKTVVGEPTKTDGQPVAVSSRGTHLLVRRPKTYDLWEIGGGRLVRSFPSYASSVPADDPTLKFNYPFDDRYAISPDGAWVAVVGTVDYKKVALYKVTRSEAVRSFDCEWGHGCGFSEDGKWFIRSHGGNVHFWDLHTDQAARSPIKVAQGKAPRVNPDGTILATEVFSRLKAWNLETDESKSLAQTPFHNFTFDVSGSQLVVANPNGSLEIWNPRTGEQSRAFGFSHFDVSRIGNYSWHGSEFVIASTSVEDGQVRVWRPEHSGARVLEGHTNDIYPVAMSRDGSIIASGSWDGTARIWNGDTGRQLFELSHPKDVQALALDPDGRRLVTVTQDREIRLWDAETGQLMLTRSHYDGVDFNPDFLFSSDRNSILCAHNHRIHRLDAKMLEIVHVHYEGRIDGIATDESESLLASISFTPDTVTFSLSLRDPESFHELRSIRLPSESVAVALSSQGRLVAVGFKDGSVGVWETHNLRNLWLATAHGGEAFDVLFEPDGSRLFSAGRDGRIKIWDPNTGEGFGELLGHNDYIMSLAISEDGTRLVSASGDDTIRIWDSPIPRATPITRAITGQQEMD